MVVSPLAFLVGAVARRSTWSLLLEVLPVWLLTMQSLVALSSQGDVDGRSSTPLFSRPVDALRTKLSSMRGQNSKLTDFLGRWTIQERHNIDEFLEGVRHTGVSPLFPWRGLAVARRILQAAGLPSECLLSDQFSTRVCRAALGFSSWQRAIISHAGQSYTLEQGPGDTLRIVTQDLRGTSQLELPLSGKAVAADDGDNGARVWRSAYIKGSPPAVVVTERARHAQIPTPGSRLPRERAKRMRVM